MSRTSVAVLMMLVVGAVVGTGIFTDTVSAERVVVEARTGNVDADGRTGVDETTDGDDTYGSVEAALSAASSGDVVSVYPGTYAETVRVNTSNVTLAGADGTTFSGAGSGAAVTVAPGADGVVVDGFRVDGYRAAVDVRRPENVTVSDLIVTDTDVGVAAATLIFGGGRPSSASVAVRNPTVRSPTDSGLSIARLDEALITNVTVTDPGASGVVVNGVDSVVVREVDLRGDASVESADGVVVASAETATVENVTVADCAENGVLIGATGSVILADITATDNGGDGVTVTDTDEVSVDGVVVRNNAEAGVDVENVSTASVADATVAGTETNGIAVSDFGTATVLRVLATNNGFSGVNLS